METPAQEKARKEYKARDWRNTGTCGVCDGNFKMGSAQALVHHGYTRPGHGSIQGDCPGVGFKPHELSSQAAASWRCSLKDYLQRLQERLAALRAGEVTTLESRRASRLNGWTASYVSKGEAGWERRLEQEVSAAHSQLQVIQSEVERFAKKVTDWAPDELPEVKLAKAQAEREARMGKL
jgi:hypothetical protein